MRGTVYRRRGLPVVLGVLAIALTPIVIMAGGAAFGAQENSGITAFRADVNLVRVPASVTEHGVPVKGLGREEFQIREDGVPQEVKYFWQEQDLPLTVGLIVDVSGSQGGLMLHHREAVARFLHQVIGPDDAAMLVTAGPQARLVTDLTGSVDDLLKGIDGIKLFGDKSPILGEPCRGVGEVRVRSVEERSLAAELRSGTRFTSPRG